MNTKPYTIAIEGIDGSGKSTCFNEIVKTIQDYYDQTSIIKCPNYHEIYKDTPLSEISKILSELSRLADEFKDFTFKTIFQYLQMTLYGSIEKFIIKNFKPEIIISERHAITSTIAYGHFYIKKIKKTTSYCSKNDLQKKVHKYFEKIGEKNFSKIKEWLASEQSGFNNKMSFYELNNYLSNLFWNKDQLIDKLSKEYRTSLPDVTIVIDVDTTVAYQRINQRNQKETLELHEEIHQLKKIREEYYEIMKHIKTKVPQKKIYLTNNDNLKKILTTIIRSNYYEKSKKII